MKVHITQGDHVGKAVIVSWVTEDEPGSDAVRYWSENSKHKKLAKGKIVTYRYFNYSSGFIHHATIRNLKVLLYSIAPLSCMLWCFSSRCNVLIFVLLFGQYNTKYYYEVGLRNTTRKFWFTTPPAIGPDVPYTFGLIGKV